MDDAALEKLFEDTNKSAEGRIAASYVTSDLQKIAPMYADEATRPAAETILQSWIDAPHNPLRKAIASVWLERARASVKKKKAGAGPNVMGSGVAAGGGNTPQGVSPAAAAKIAAAAAAHALPSQGKVGMSNPTSPSKTPD